MRTRMPHVIDAYIHASNSRNADRFGYQCLRNKPPRKVWGRTVKEVADA
jgi:hypothetical protein